MGYRIGEVARMFDLSSEGVRFLERKGLIAGKRAENGYRIYEKSDLFTLIQCLNYSKMGFTLGQASDLFFSKSISDTIEKFSHQVREQEETLQKETLMLSCMKEWEKRLENSFLNEGRLMIEKVPGMYCCGSRSFEEGRDIKTDYFKLTAGLAPLGVCGRHFRRLGDTYETAGEVCTYIEEDKVRQMEIDPPKEALYCPSCICAVQTINIGAENAAAYDYIKTAMETVKAEGFRSVGDIHVWYIFFSFKEGAEQRYCKIMIPIDSEKWKA